MPPRTAPQSTQARPTPAAAPTPAPAPAPGPVVTTPAAAGPGGNTAAVSRGDTAGPAPETAASPASPAQADPAPTTADTSTDAATASLSTPDNTGASETDTPPPTASDSAAIRILAASRPSAAGAAVTAAGTSADAELTADRAALAANPPSLDAPSGLTPGSNTAGTGGQAGDAGTAAGPAMAAAIDQAAGDGTTPEPADTSHVTSDAPVPTGPSPQAAVNSAPEDPAARAQAYANVIRMFPTSDDTINTDPGPPPPMALTGEADPGRIATQDTENHALFGTEWINARSGMAEDPGINNIYPTLPDERLIAPTTAGSGGVAPLATPETITLSDATRNGFDQGHEPLWAAEVAGADTDHAAAMERRNSDEAARRAETARDIADLEAGARGEQIGHRNTANTEVIAARSEWQARIETAEGTYGTERTRIQGAVDTDVADRVELANTQAQGHLDEGQRQAETRQTEVETEATRRRAEADRRRAAADGFFDWVSSRVSAFFQALKDGLKTLFDGLRTFVTNTIEGAKKLAAAAIETGRQAIVGIIRIHGAALETAADIFLAEFPAARDWAKDRIREGTRLAEEGVNAAAEALREGVFALLDGLGAALEFILDAYEAFYTAMLDIFEGLVLGYIEIQRALFYLELAASYAPGELEGQLYEEMIGADLSQPLPFEMTAAEMATMQAGGEASGATGPAGGGVPAGPTGIEVDPVISFDPDPDLITEVMDAGGSMEFGGLGESAPTMAELYAEGQAPADAETGDVEGGETAPARMTLEDYMNVEPSSSCRSDAPAGPEGEPIPLSAKIPPLSKGQRAQYMLSQAWGGIKSWAACNWGYILAGVIAAIALIAVLAATGTLGPAMAILAPVLTAAFAIYSIAMALGHLQDYLTKSIAGDTIGGAKSLARSAAVVGVEIIFAVLTYVTAGAFRAIAAVGRGAANITRGAGRAIGAAARRVGSGLRTAGRGAAASTARGLRASGRVGRGVVRAGGAVVRRGRIIVGNVRRGFARGAKSVRELGERLGQRLRFKRYRIIRRMRRLVIQGLINPWITIAGTESSAWVDDVGENVSRPGRRARSGDTIRGTTETGEAVEGVVFGGSRNNPRYRRLAEQGGLNPDSNVIHHAIEQQVLNNFPGAFTRAEINSLSRLRSIRKGVFNSRVHLSRIRVMWDRAYTAIRRAGLTVAQQRRALQAYMGRVDEFIESMNRFARNNPAYKAAEAAGDSGLMQRLLDAEISRLAATPRFDMGTYIDNVIRGL